MGYFYQDNVYMILFFFAAALSALLILICVVNRDVPSSLAGVARALFLSSGNRVMNIYFLITFTMPNRCKIVVFSAKITRVLHDISHNKHQLAKLRKFMKLFNIWDNLP